LYKGAKKDSVIQRIASTFVALCEYADFSSPIRRNVAKETDQKPEPEEGPDENASSGVPQTAETRDKPTVSLDSLQYHINIVLPDTRDQAVFDAIFKSLRDHIGPVS
jgi:hypothetical protein